MSGRDSQVRKRDTWSGYLTRANADDVALRAREMFMNKSLIVVTLGSIVDRDWPIIETTRLVGVQCHPVMHHYRLFEIETTLSTYAIEIHAEDQEAALSRKEEDRTRILFRHDRLDIQTYSPSGHKHRYTFVVDVDRENGD